MHYKLSCSLAVTLVITGAISGQGPPRLANVHKGAEASAVSGESWIRHLNRPFEETAMGKTEHLGPAAGQKDATDLIQVRTVPATPRLVSGEDLYRLNCQACHGESGQGSPPEINSVINPARAPSTPLVLQRMKSTGMEITQADAAQLSKQASTALLQRLHEGGENMPPFSYLNEAEVNAVIAYLKQLAGVPGAEGKQRALREPPVRVGELIVKSACHTCHDATGTNPNPQQMVKGDIPPLETLRAREDEAIFIRKVTHGAPVLMGDVPIVPLENLEMPERVPFILFS
jgi:mono/diheme cytochrome c family protein